MTRLSTFPVAVVGAGPVGLAAAAHLIERGLSPVIFEKGAKIAASMRAWAHVRVFSPWLYNIDPAARRLLEAAGWEAPDEMELPTGGEIISRYLEPLAALPQLTHCLRLGATVTAITRSGLDKMTNNDRDNTPFAVRWSDGTAEHVTLVSAVIDASGTWNRPNPIGIDGLPVPGEMANADVIAYGIPDIAAERATYAGKRVLVVGSGHSAIQTALALLTLQESEPDTRVFWAMRRNRLDRILGGGLNDQLPARGELGLAARKAIDAGRLDVLAPFAVRRIERGRAGLTVSATLSGHAITLEVDRIVVATGFRPDLSMLSELRVQLDPAVEAPPMLAPLIDPNFHSCGSVPPHGIDELAHPETGFVIAGSKSYGRAPTFLMATGYEQVRSIAAELAGDPVAARQVQLVLPETGVCSTSSLLGEASESSCCGTAAESSPAVAVSSCCGGPAASTDACCVADEAARSEGLSGCGCGTPGSTVRQFATS
jgi:thioredoxin reductase